MSFRRLCGVCSDVLVGVVVNFCQVGCVLVESLCGYRLDEGGNHFLHEEAAGKRARAGGVRGHILVQRVHVSRGKISTEKGR